MITRAEYFKLKKMLKNAGWEHQFSVMDNSGGSGSLYVKNGKEFFWNKDKTKQNILQLIEEN